MPRVHFVKKARKDNPACSAGESYYHWKFRYGPKKFSKTPPKPCQLTQSEFLSTVYELNDQIEAIEASDIDDLRESVKSLADEFRTLGDEQQEKVYNMPESLQDSTTGQLLEERCSGCAEVADQLEDIDFDACTEDALQEEAVDAVRDETPDKPGDWDPPEDLVKTKLDELMGEKMETLLDEIHAIQYEGD